MDRPRLVHTRGELALAREALGADVALVPTMGALHRGHAELLRQARARARATVVSIFVNPLQFGEAADLDRYPRTLDADLAVCAAEGREPGPRPVDERNALLPRRSGQVDRVRLADLRRPGQEEFGKL